MEYFLSSRSQRGGLLRRVEWLATERPKTMQGNAYNIGRTGRDGSDPRLSLAVGRRLPAHAFTRQGVLLLARGELVKDDVQLRRLLREDVVFADELPPGPASGGKRPALSVPARREDRPRQREDLPMPRPPPPPDTTTYLQEIPIARLLRVTAMRQVSQVIEEVRSGRMVDLAPVRHAVAEIVSSAQRNPEALCSLVRLKTMDDYTFAHSVDVCVLSVMIARQQESEAGLEDLGLGALLHDIGKSALAPEVLQKPGPLTEEEWYQVRQHPRVGLELLSRRRQVNATVAQAVTQHHERLDGSGYPEGLRDREIEPGGRIVAVADVYDAMTSNRPHHGAKPPAEAVRWISQHVGQFFDPNVALAFVRAMGVYPVGSLVRLNTGELAVVTAANPQAVRQPRVLVVSTPLGLPLTRPSRLDLAHPRLLALRREISEVVDPSGLNFDPEAYLETAEAAPEYQASSLNSRA